jgi:hypothetical protein
MKLNINKFNSPEDILENKIYQQDVQRWIRTMEWRDVMQKENNNRELGNILERFILSELNNVPASIIIAHHECLQKNIDYPIAKLLNKKYEYRPIEYKVTSQHLIIEKRKIPWTDRLNLLYLKLIELLNDKSNVVQMADLILVWLWIANDSLMPMGQHWGILWTVVGYLNMFNFAEGFCSPFNSRMIDFDNRPVFHSLMKVDELLGSQGSILKAKLHQGDHNWFLNPPYVEDIMEQTIDLILKACYHPVGKIYICMFPTWTDSLAYIKGQNSKYCINILTFNPGEYLYQDPNKKYIKPGNSKMSIFIFGDHNTILPSDFINTLSSLFNKMVV